ncbi:serine hydrolase [Cyanobium sp. NIES-981]|uniref:serine hydrolase domain-containing protein n=1 Tax=Cyanobium sp. NIES-981 TaxID=1851505 RepID=UPI000B35CD27|nr:serine hydrolase [Cyanobium sp. NIES-981]
MGAAAPDGRPWTAASSDPRTLGWMQGSPPPPDRVIGFGDPQAFSFPRLRWSVCHTDQLMPTRAVSRGLGPVRPLPRQERADLDAVRFQPWGTSQPMTWGQAFDANFTDGLLVLHRGAVVYERYAGCLGPTGRHAAMSLTKSLVGLLGEVLVAEGVLNANAQVCATIPELAGSAFGEATVRQVLDMTTALDYSEDYADLNAGVWKHAAAGNALPKPSDYSGPRTYFEFLQTVKPKGVHGQAFGYKTVNTDVLGWLISRATGQPLTDVMAERLWSRLGAEAGAFFSVDSIGTPFAGGGFNASLRDMARVGQLMLEEGRVGTEQVIPAAVIRGIRAGGDRAAFARAGYKQLQGWSYRGMWWVSHDANGTVMARGVHGQSLWIDPAARVVIARFASHPVAGNAANDATTLPAYRAISRHLVSHSVRR